MPVLRHSAPRCNALYDKCKGADGDSCWPYHIWTGTPAGGKYHTLMLNNGSFYENSNSPYPTTLAFSVRCVLGYKAHNCSLYTPRCYRLDSKCKGAAPGISDADKCYPFHMWSGTRSDSGRAYNFPLSKGAFILDVTCGGEGCPYTEAFSVRCVLGYKILCKSL